MTKTNPVQASPLKGKSFEWEFKLTLKTRLLPPASCLLPSLTQRQLSEILQDILEAIADIEAFTDGVDFETFRTNREKILKEYLRI